jgi:hypothetical protein
MGTNHEILPGLPAGEQPVVEKGSVAPVVADTFARRIHVEWDGSATVAPLGQLPFFIEYLKQGGLSVADATRMPPPPSFQQERLTGNLSMPSPPDRYLRPIGRRGFLKWHEGNWIGPGASSRRGSGSKRCCYSPDCLGGCVGPSCRRRLGGSRREQAQYQREQTQGQENERSVAGQSHPPTAALLGRRRLSLQPSDLLGRHYTHTQLHTRRPARTRAASLT